MRALMMSTTRFEISIPYVAYVWSRKLTGRLQASTANEETVNIGLGSELAAVLLADGATVDDTDVVLSLGADGLAEPLTDSGVNLLGLLGGSDLAGTDSPDRLVGNDDLSPLLLGQLLGGGVELTGNDLDGLVGLTLLYDCKWNRV
jgi:hypothetical protein